MSRLLILPLLYLLSIGANAAETTPPKGVAIRLFAVALNPDQGPVCVLIGDTRNPEFVIPTTSLSKPQTVSARDFRLVSATGPPESPPIPVASIHLPDQGSDFRVILVPAANNTYQAVVVRGDDAKFSHGDFFFINLSTSPMLGLLGTSRLDLKPGAQEIIRPAGAKSEKFFEVKFARRENDKLLPLTNTCWPIVRDNRSFIIFHNGKNGRPTYRAVDEFMPLAAD